MKSTSLIKRKEKDRWEKILTKKQKKKLIDDSSKMLLKLILLPERKDLLKDIFIANIKSGGSSYSYGSLYFNQEGLIEETGYHECSFGDSCWPTNSEKCLPVIIKEKDFKRVVERYKLTPEKISEIIELIIT